MLSVENIGVTVKLYGVFRIDRFKEQRLEFPAGTRVDEVVEALQLNRQLLGIILINDRHADLHSVPGAEDVLALLPILDGG